MWMLNPAQLFAFIPVFFSFVLLIQVPIFLKTCTPFCSVKPIPIFFTRWMPFLLPNQLCQSTEGKNITFHGLAYPKLTWASSNFVFVH